MSSVVSPRGSPPPWGCCLRPKLAAQWTPTPWTAVRRSPRFAARSRSDCRWICTERLRITRKSRGGWKMEGDRRMIGAVKSIDCLTVSDARGGGSEPSRMGSVHEEEACPRGPARQMSSSGHRDGRVKCFDQLWAVQGAAWAQSRAFWNRGHGLRVAPALHLFAGRVVERERERERTLATNPLSVVWCSTESQ